MSGDSDIRRVRTFPVVPRGLSLAGGLVLIALSAPALSWALDDILGPEPRHAAAIALLSFLAAGISLVIAVWSWLVFGRERLTVADGSVSIIRQGVFRSIERVFPLDACHALRMNPPFGYPWLESVRDNVAIGRLRFPMGTVAFDAGAEVVRFGDFLEEHEAQSVVEFLAHVIPLEDDESAAIVDPAAAQLASASP